MMLETTLCICNHELVLHDRYGCAAYLGAFRETADRRTYCPCKRPFGVLLASAPPPSVVASPERSETA